MHHQQSGGILIRFPRRATDDPDTQGWLREGKLRFNAARDRPAPIQRIPAVGSTEERIHAFLGDPGDIGHLAAAARAASEEQARRALDLMALCVEALAEENRQTAFYVELLAQQKQQSARYVEALEEHRRRTASYVQLLAEHERLATEYVTALRRHVG